MLYEGQEQKDCCGCSACSRICPKEAITMRRSAHGFLYPSVDQEKCVHCDLCRRVCPMEKNYVGEEASPDVYAACHRDEAVLKESSSGGMFTALANYILQEGGTVYGAAFDDEFTVCHMRAETPKEASRFRTSKYVESDIRPVYDEVKRDLENGRSVLLTGTPCQISAITEYLKLKRVNTEKLYTCDNICHGVPSRKVWKDYLGILKERYIPEGDEIISVNMRSKRVSWKEQVMDITLREGDLTDVIRDFSFNRFFLSLNAHRPSCFHCRYTSYLRPADFTLGDFWNVENAGIGFDTQKGVNALLVNTEKGRELLEKIRGRVLLQKSTKEKVWQPHLEYSAKAPSARGEFWKEYDRASDLAQKEQVLRKYLKGNMLNRLIRSVSPLLRKTGLYSFAGKMYKKILVR